MSKQYLLEQLHINVLAMRRHQIAYFKQHDKWNLTESKKYEKRTDELLGLLATLPADETK